MPLPLRTDFNAAALRAIARQTKDGPQARRLLALAAIYDGASRSEAAGIGPASTRATKAARCASVSLEGWPGGLRLTRPAGPWALNFTTQSRTICPVTPPIRAASVRVAPS